jgi:hypothetical protein
MQEKKQPIQIFVASENKTNACNMSNTLLIVIIQFCILSMQLYDCISQSTFVSMSLNDLVMCGHSVVQPRHRVKSLVQGRPDLRKFTPRGGYLVAGFGVT